MKVLLTGSSGFIGAALTTKLLPIQPGDVPDTYVDLADLVRDFDYKPSITINQGVIKLVEWYKDYYNI